MRLATAKIGSAEDAVVVLPGGVLPVGDIQEGWPTDLLSLLEGGHLDDLRRWWSGLSEAELAELSERASVVAGFATILDMTAEDILRRNPRYLTRAKSFFSFGPRLVTPDEVGEIGELEVATVLNGEVRRKDVVSNMNFSPWSLVSFHSKVMTLLPGDIIRTGTWWGAG